MKFDLLPAIHTMYELYQQPRGAERFKEYLQLLQGNSDDDMHMPIGGYNPMAKDHLLTKLIELKEINAEQIVQDTLEMLNEKLANEYTGRNIKVALNVSDDLHGAWTNRYTADYDSKFKINALVSRSFCTPVLWTSESYDGQKVAARTLEYCYRTFLWLQLGKPHTLAEHVFLEQQVAAAANSAVNQAINYKNADAFFHTNKDSTDYLVIFNFLYGDEAMRSLGNNPKGVTDDFAGFEYARMLANI